MKAGRRAEEASAGNLGTFHGCGAEGTSLEGKKGATEPRLLLLPYHSISPPKGSQQMEHSKDAPRVPLPDHRMWHPGEAAGILQPDHG